MKYDDYELYENIAQGCLTNSKHPNRFVRPFYPTVINGGMGPYIYDTENREYIDFICGLGGNLFGYNCPQIEGPHEKSMFGCHSFPTVHEINLGKRIREFFPFIEKVKFVNDGSSGCSAAIDIAKAYQDKRYRFFVFSDGYHGWHSLFKSVYSDPDVGCVRKLPKDLEDIRADWTGWADWISCIIIEPIILDDSKERRDYLSKLREFCTKNEIILIFDETITGLRFDSQLVSKSWCIDPDIVIFGKALANGDKISCVGGKAKYMQGDYFVSGTFHGHTRPIIAANRCLNLSIKKDPKVLMDHGKYFMEQLNIEAKGLFELKGYGTRGSFVGNEVTIALFFQEMAKAKVLFGPSFFISYAHIELLDDVMKLARSAIDKIRTGEATLVGKLPTPPFSKRVRDAR
jgi:glutamate-1-semialdehyde 2,1-aminomutase